jgi:hypothetical protein
MTIPRAGQDPSSGFEHLALIAFGENSEEGVMAFLVDYTACFDDSGTHPESPTAVCAGYVATVAQWRHFEREWREADAHEPFMPFHTTDFLSRHRQFEGWDQQRADGLLRKLTGIINGRVRYAVISAVVKKDYDEVVPEWLKERAGRKPFTFCVTSCLGFIKQWRDKYKIASPIEYVFDWMGKGKGEIMGAFEGLIKYEHYDDIGAYKGGLSFQTKDKFVQLQAADIIATAGGRHMNRKVLAGKSMHSEPLFNEVMEFKPRPSNRYFDRENLTQWVAQMGKHKDDPNWGIV